MKTGPMILLSAQFEQLNNVIYREECDCACPDGGFAFSAPTLSPVEPLHCASLHIQDLPQKHTLMFNPLHDSGVAVLNPKARQIWEHFCLPRPLQSLATRGDDWISTAQRMAKTGLLEAVDTQDQLSKAPPRTLGAWMHVSNRCSLNCAYCYLKKSNEAMSAQVGRAAVDAIIRSATKGGFKAVKLKFAGGEPTLNLGLVFDVYRYAQSQTAQVGLELDAVILSNGVAMSDGAIARLQASGIRIMVSLDGIGETHDSQRKFANGKGSFARVDQTLSKLIAYGIKPFISITLCNRNAEGLADVVSYVLDRGLPFNINFLRDNGCTACQADLALVDEHIIKAMRRAFAVIEARLPDHSLLGSLVDRSQFVQPHDKTCGVGESYLVIDHCGNVAKCQMQIDRPVTTIYADDPLVIVQADKDGVQNPSVEEKETCRECEWRYWCAGGCPLLAFRTTGRYDTKSPYCRIYKAIYPDLLRLEGLRLMKLGGVDVVA